MFGFLNIFKSRDQKQGKGILNQDKLARFLKNETEKDQARLRGLAFDLKKAHDEGLRLLEDIDYDKSKLDKIYFDPKTKTLRILKKSSRYCKILTIEFSFSFFFLGYLIYLKFYSLFYKFF